MTAEPADDETLLRAGDVVARVSARGGRLTSLAIGDLEMLQQGVPYGCFPMVPWCGRMRDGVLRFAGSTHRFEPDDPPHALHGTARDHIWQVDEADDDRLRLRHELQPWWPYAGTVTQTVSLEPTALAMTLRIASGGEDFPAQAGWHPWFRRRLTSDPAGALRVAFTPEWQEERGADYLPTGRRISPRPTPWDDCFGTPDGVDVGLEWPGLAHMRIRSDARWVVVFDHRPFATCIEPQTGPPNGINTAPGIVRPGQDLVVTTRWTW